jgi:hypothetical protein
MRMRLSRLWTSRARLSVGPITGSAAFAARLKVGPYSAPCNLRVFRQLVRELLDGNTGAEIAEAAVVLPVVLLFLFAIIWFGLAFNIYSTITSAAREGARTAARPTCAVCAAPSPAWSTSNLPGDSIVENSVLAVLQASHVDTSKITLYSPGVTFCTPPSPLAAGACSTTGTNLTICRYVELNPSGSPQQCGTLVSFQYPFSFLLTYTPTALGSQGVTITAEAEARMEE